MTQKKKQLRVTHHGKFIIVLVVLITNMFSSALANEQIGQTYRIIEEDILSLIHKRASKIKFDKEALKKKAENLIPKDNINLPRAEKERVFFPDMHYQSEFDVTNQHGEIIYPKGYRYNAADFNQLIHPYIVFAAKDEEQLAWFQKNYQNDIRAKVIVTDGNYFKLSQKWKRPVYYLPKKMVESFKLKAVPSVITQVGNQVMVKEIDVKKDEN